MKLSSRALKELDVALNKAFKDRHKLKKMVRYDLGINLNSISREDKIEIVIFDLIEWAETRGRLADLVDEAFKANPDNPDLKAWKAQYYDTILNQMQPENPVENYQSEIFQIGESENQNLTGDNRPLPNLKFSIRIVYILCWIPLSFYIIWGVIESPSIKNLITSLISFIVIIIAFIFTNLYDYIENSQESFVLVIVTIGLGTIAGALNGLMYGILGAVTGVIALKTAKFFAHNYRF